MISAKLAILGRVKNKSILNWNKGYNVIISVHDITNQSLSFESNYIVDAAM